MEIPTHFDSLLFLTRMLCSDEREKQASTLK